ncbi:MAG: hypothetical protein ACR2QQ_15485 [Gammaproteobacteria bacterium]
MAISNPCNRNDEDLSEGDLTTTAQVLSAKEILDSLESDAAEQREAALSRKRRSLWRKVLNWVGLK